MQLKENKYFIFDREKKLNLKLIIKNILYFFRTVLYGISFIFIHPKYTEKKYKVSICAIFKNEALYLKEWIEYNHQVGIEHFYLYNNNSNDNYQDVLEPYIKSGLVTLIDWPIEQGQMAAYANCVNSFKHEANWIGFLDLDELVIPIKDNNIYDFLKKYKNRPNVLIYWKMFCSSGKISRNTSNLMSEDLVISWPKLVDIGKCFFNTAFDYSENLKGNEHMHYHWSLFNGIKLPVVNIFGKICFPNYNPMKNKNIPIQINHYFTKSYDEYLAKVSRGDAYFLENPRNDAYFYRHEMLCTSVDYVAYKYLIRVKRIMGIKK